MARLKISNGEKVQTNTKQVRILLAKKKSDDQRRKKSLSKQDTVVSNVFSSGVSESKRLPYRHRPGSKALQAIRRYQRGKDLILCHLHEIQYQIQILLFIGTGFLIPRTAFRRVIRQISDELTNATKMR